MSHQIGFGEVADNGEFDRHRREHTADAGDECHVGVFDAFFAHECNERWWNNQCREREHGHNKKHRQRHGILLKGGTSLTRTAASWIIAATAFLSAPSFADDATILDLQLEIQRLLNEQPAEVIKPVEILPEPLIQGTATQEREASPVVKAPHIIATVADRGCGPCERWKSETLPALEAAGWRVQVNVVPFGSEAVPSFRMGSRKLEGYTTRAAFYAWASPRQVSLPPATVAVVSQPAAAVVSIPPARRTWTYNGRDLAAHIRNVHGVNVPPGLSHSQLVRLHSHAHENTLHLVRQSGFSSTSPVRQTYYSRAPQAWCPSGRCP